MITLSIDTTDRYKITIGLLLKDMNHVLSSKKTSDSQALLPLIVKILKKNELNLKDIEAIEVNVGPGSFMGIRIGVSIANAIGEALKIPINGNKVGQLVEPNYT